MNQTLNVEVSVAESCPSYVLPNTRGGHDSKIFLINMWLVGVGKYMRGHHYRLSMKLISMVNVIIFIKMHITGW